MRKNITKELAKQLTNKFLANEQKEIDSLNEQLKIESYNLARTKIDADIIALFENKPAYFYTSNTVHFKGKGIDEEINIFDSLPRYSHRYYLSLNVTEKEFKPILNILDSYTSKKTALNKKRPLLESTIFSFRTIKNLEKGFPEVYSLLTPTDKNTNTSLMVNIDDVRKVLGLKPIEEVVNQKL